MLQARKIAEDWRADAATLSDIADIDFTRADEREQSTLTMCAEELEAKFSKDDVQAAIFEILRMHEESFKGMYSECRGCDFWVSAESHPEGAAEPFDKHRAELIAQALVG